MGLFSSLWSTATSIVSSIGSVASGVYKKVKEYAGAAISWMAEKAEGFIGNISQMWERIKPHISTGRKIIKFLSNTVPLPWLKTALQGLDRALAWLEKIDKHPLVCKTQKAMEWVIEQCKNMHQKMLDEETLAEARRHAVSLEEAEHELQGKEKSAVAALAMINRYLIAKAEVDNAVKRDELKDFEYFLRLRAVQKLLGFYEAQMENITTVEEIDEDMHFLVFAANALIEQDAEFSEQNTLHLDDLTTRKFGKPIIPFIFEEMIASWEKTRQIMQEEWNQQNSRLAKDRLLHNRLVRTQKYEELDAAEVATLNDLIITLPRDTATLEALGQDLLTRSNYVNAAEGFLQMLEKDEQQLIDDGQEYLLEQGAEVGRLLIDCSQNNRPWSSLSQDEQALINDFANIFEQACQVRTAKLLTLVEVAA